MIRALDVNAGNAAEKAMGHELALDFVPDLGKTGVEFLSNLLLFHGPSPIAGYSVWYAVASMRKPRELCPRKNTSPPFGLR